MRQLTELGKIPGAFGTGGASLPDEHSVASKDSKSKSKRSAPTTHQQGDELVIMQQVTVAQKGLAQAKKDGDDSMTEFWKSQLSQCTAKLSSSQAATTS
jgi:hypothetical protein